MWPYVTMRKTDKIIIHGKMNSYHLAFGAEWEIATWMILALVYYGQVRLAGAQFLNKIQRTVYFSTFSVRLMVL